MIIIRGEIGVVTIKILANKTSGTQDFWEENWLYANVKGEFPGFKADYHCNLRTDDFERCINELTSMLVDHNENEIARFNTIEEGLQMVFAIKEGGSIKVTGKMTATELTYCVLEFNFTTDIPTIQQILGAMQQVIIKYPIIGQP